MSIAIEKLKHLKIDSDSLETWEALRPISEFTKDTGNSVILFSILMIVGFIGYYLTAKKIKPANQAVQLTRATEGLLKRSETIPVSCHCPFCPMALSTDLDRSSRHDVAFLYVITVA